jgi:hypothetical protein
MIENKYQTVQSLMAQTGLSRSAINSALKLLHKLDFVRTQRRKSPDGKRELIAIRYIVCEKIFAFVGWLKRWNQYVKHMHPRPAVTTQVAEVINTAKTPLDHLALVRGMLGGVLPDTS